MAGLTARVIARGAEALVTHTYYLGRDAVSKQRLPHSYRHPQLDERLRTERLRAEAAVIARARAHGIRVPAVLDIDRARGILVLERLDGPTLRQALADEPHVCLPLLTAWGADVGRLHSAGLVHGDLTTSNAIVVDGRPVLIDFGLASFSTQVEDQGADLVLVARTLETTNASAADTWMSTFLDGYVAGNAASDAAVDRMKDIRGRARYV